jgi:hypothetical protein
MSQVIVISQANSLNIFHLCFCANWGKTKGWPERYQKSSVVASFIILFIHSRSTDTYYDHFGATSLSSF